MQCKGSIGGLSRDSLKMECVSHDILTSGRKRRGAIISSELGSEEMYIKAYPKGHLA